jgi:hypothetical protein
MIDNRRTNRPTARRAGKRTENKLEIADLIQADPDPTQQGCERAVKHDNLRGNNANNKRCVIDY